jgi:hypothetical protein
MNWNMMIMKHDMMMMWSQKSQRTQNTRQHSQQSLPPNPIDFQRHLDLSCETYLSIHQNKEYYILIDRIRYRNLVD